MGKLFHRMIAAVIAALGLLLPLLVVAAPTAAAAEPAYYLPWPAGSSYKVSQSPGGSYSHNTSYTRYAVDFALPLDATVISSAPGVVRLASDRGDGFGKAVWVDHGDGACTIYAHLNSMSVGVGQQVGQGQLVGRAGNTGRSSGVHLHWGKMQCGTYTSMPISTVETGGSFPYGAWLTSRNTSVVDPGWTDVPGWASDVAMTGIAGGWNSFTSVVAGRSSGARISTESSRLGRLSLARGLSGSRSRVLATDGPNYFNVGMNDQLYHHWESTPGGDISRWHGLGGYVKEIAAARAGSTWEVFAVGGDNAIYRATQLNTAWQRMAGTWAHGVAAATSRDGRIELFHIAGGRNVMHAWQSSPGSGFGAWRNLGGWKTAIGASSVGNGEYELYAIGGSNTIWRSAPWSGVAGWQQLAGRAVRVSGARHPDGHVELFVVNSVGNMFHAWQKRVGGF